MTINFPRQTLLPSVGQLVNYLVNLSVSKSVMGR